MNGKMGKKIKKTWPGTPGHAEERKDLEHHS
jgi:hypothetical protein